MNPIVIFSLNDPVLINDWYLLVMTVSFLLTVAFIGPFIDTYSKGISVMFRFSSPESDICFPKYAPWGFVSLSLISCINLGLALTAVKWDVSREGADMLLHALSASGVFGLSCALKLILYQTVNSSLYKSQATSLKPTRWNGFFVMAFAVFSLAVLIITAVVLFLNLPAPVLVIGASLLLVAIETGLVFKMKTTIFKNKCSLLGFILYLCALESVPILLMWVLISKTLC